MRLLVGSTDSEKHALRKPAGLACNNPKCTSSFATLGGAFPIGVVADRIMLPLIDRRQTLKSDIFAYPFTLLARHLTAKNVYLLSLLLESLPNAGPSMDWNHAGSVDPAEKERDKCTRRRD